MMIAWISLMPLMGLAFWAAPVNAVDIGEGLDLVGTGAQLDASKTLPELIGVFINVFLGFLGIIFLILVLYAGFLWMTAGGNDTKVEQAKKILSQAIIGLILIMASYAISTFVVTSISEAGL
jgi:hypothetical protein